MTDPKQPIPTDRLLRSAVASLAAAGIESPRADAELLAAHALGISRQELAYGLVTGRAVFGPAQRAEFSKLVARRELREPLQHLTGSAPFRHLELAVGPGVFIPRPETELLAGWGIERLVAAGNRPLRAVDLCAGSGAIGLALATEVPTVEVHLVERDPDALRWLRRNVANFQEVGENSEATSWKLARGAEAGATSSRVMVTKGDATDPATLAELDGTVDLVLSNPPYIDRAEPVAPEAALHDPAVALWADDGGLAVLRGVVARASVLLRPGGWLGMEHGETQGAAVRQLLTGAGWREAMTHPDLTGRDRFTTAQRS